VDGNYLLLQTQKSELLECQKFETIHWRNVKVSSKFHQTCMLLNIGIVLVIEHIFD